MKECKNSGKWNFSNVNRCLTCGESIQNESSSIGNATFAHEPLNYQYHKESSMHWFWSFLIMVIIRIVGSWLVNFLFVSNSFDRAYGFLYIINMSIYYVSIYVWVSLSVDRYFSAWVWAFFTYLWLLAVPITSAGEYIYLSSKSLYSDSSFITVTAVILSFIGTLVFARYRKRNMYRIEYTRRKKQGISIETEMASKNGLHWVLILLICLIIINASEWITFNIYVTIILELRPYNFLQIIYALYRIILLLFVGLADYLWVRLSAWRYHNHKVWIKLTYAWIVLSLFLHMQT